MNKKNLFFKPGIYLTMAIYIILTFTVLAFGDRVASAALPEDHFFENVGALSFFLTSVLFFSAFIRVRTFRDASRVFWIKQLVYLGFAILFLFGAGEEISWGQRIFNVQTPDSLNAINAQGEITVHNISFNGYEIPFERLFDIFWLTLTVLLPITSVFVKPFERFVDKFSPIVHWGIGLLFLFNYTWAKVAKIMFQTVYTYGQVPFVQAVQEIKESNYALLFVLIALFVFLDLNRSRDDSNALKEFS